MQAWGDCLKRGKNLDENLLQEGLELNDRFNRTRIISTKVVDIVRAGPENLEALCNLVINGLKQ